MEKTLLTNSKGNCINEKRLNKFNPELHKKIIQYNQLNGFSFCSWSCKTYNYLNNLKENPKCLCGNLVKFLTFKSGYNKFCSVKCSANSINEIEKRKKTLLNKYGVENISQNSSIKNKKRETLLKNYGVTHPLKSSTIKNSIKDKNIKNWGVENVSQSTTIKRKKEKTMLNKYGVKHGFQSEEVKEKIKKTISQKYGVDYYVQSNENKKNIKNSVNKKRIDFYSNLLNVSISDIEITDDIFKIKNLCKYHNEFTINRYQLYNRVVVGKIENICTICNPINEHSSIKENEIRDFIETELNVKTVKIRIENKEIDIYLPDYKLGIEFNGLYWHSDINKENDYHLNKTEICNRNNIELIHIFEDEWVYKREIVRNIIKSKLNIFSKRIYARKCKVEKISSKELKIFLNENHLQGSVNSKVKLGLFYENELVSVMSFSKKRIALNNKNNQNNYEMVRFCSKLSYNIIGGASKLLTFFIRNYKPDTITSFADRRYSTGNLYTKLGFDFLYNTKPNYWYFNLKDLVRYHRFSFRKDVLVKRGFDSNLTENQIMKNLGYLRIYDSGNMKFQKFCFI